MKTKKLFLATLLVATVATSAFGQTPQREVVFTLNANEVIYENEYLLSAEIGENTSFTGLLLDTLKKRNGQIFVLNGKRIVTAADIYVSDIDRETGNYSLVYSVYEDNGKDWYLIISGIKKGPYQAAHIIGNDNGRVVYEYILGDHWYDNTSGKIKLSQKNDDNKYHIDWMESSGILRRGNEVIFIFDYGNGRGKISANGKYYVYTYKDATGKTRIESNGYGADFYDQCKFEGLDDYSLEIYNNSYISYTASKDGKSIKVFGRNTDVSVRAVCEKEDNYFYITYDGDGYYHIYGNINGKSISEYNLQYADDGNVRYSQWQDYYFTYKKNNSWYININGKNYGGYEDNVGYAIVRDGTFMYKFEKGDKQYLNINGKITEGHKWMGRYAMNSKGDYLYVYHDSTLLKGIVNKNGQDIKTVGTFEYDILLLDNSHHAFYYNLNGAYFIHVNGNDITVPKEHKMITTSLQISEKGDYAYLYQNDGLYYVNINGKVFGGYEYANASSSREYNNLWGIYYRYKDADKEYYILTFNGRVYEKVNAIAFDKTGCVFSFEQDGKYYVNINGHLSRPFTNPISYVRWKDGNYFYRYVDTADENEYYHVKIHGTVYEKANSAYFDSVDATGAVSSYSVYYTENGEEYTDHNGVVSKDEEGFENRVLDGMRSEDVITSDDEEHSFVNSYKNGFVVIDGRSYGQSPALYSEYNKERNAFIWHAIEGNELVVYEYKLN
jgi:hypothetical protein